MSKHLGITRRNAITLAAGSAAAWSISLRSAAAQRAYPTKPVRVIVPYSAGGGADAISRTLFGRLSEDFGQQFIIDNRGGGGGTIGAGAVAKAPADGYTILHDATGFAVNPALFPRLPYDARKDFQPVFLAGTLPLLLLVHPSVQAKSVAEVVALAKASPDGLNWASAGNGSVQHLALELFSRLAEIKLNHVPYKGGAPALNDLIGGHVKFYFSNTAAASPHVKAGSVRAIAHTGQTAIAAFPDLRPASEAIPGFEAVEWNGVFVPAATPKDIVDRLSAGLNAALRAPSVAERLASLSVETRQNSPDEFVAFVNSEIEKWGRVVREAQIKPD